MVIRAWELLATALATTGCSFFMNTAPSAPSERTTLAASTCTNSPTLPLGDTVGAMVGALNIGIASAASSDEDLTYYGGGVSKKAGLAIGITGLAVFGAAATYGFIQMSRCNTLRREVNLDTTPPEERHDPEPKSREDVAEGAGPASASALLDPSSSSGAPAPTPEPEHQLPSWSALRRVPMTAKPAPRMQSGPRNGPP